MSGIPKKANPDASQDKPSQGQGRYAAGEDPVKREQILDGAKSVFMRLGFDAASMNDVTREAGVSKGTVYVYFSSKEELFAALINREKSLFSMKLRDVIAESNDVADALYQFGITFVTQMTGTGMVPAMRTLLGVIDRMPGLCKNFFAASPINAVTVLIEFFNRPDVKARLDIDDRELAARQFIDACSATFFKSRLLDEILATPPDKEVHRYVSRAVDMFMRFYTRKP
ncbi:TetR/AcrR family transcriptional regulator [Agrobacterium sp. ES01]|uniref:TetR/AcrR family transcriptional regulator n=1 Tax=Agrobacterium sp. ES01 TaxID=3420714 RepID=UPI003D0E8980